MLKTSLRMYFEHVCKHGKKTQEVIISKNVSGKERLIKTDYSNNKLKIDYLLSNTRKNKTCSSSYKASHKVCKIYLKGKIKSPKT